MNLRKYYITTSLMALILSPVAVSIVLAGVALFVPSLGVMLIVPPILTLALVWVVYSKIATLPENASELFMPIFFAFCYYMCVWIAVFGLSSYRFDSNLFENIYCILTIPYFVINFFFAFGGDYSLFPPANTAIAVITILSTIITCAISKKKIVFDKKIIVYGAVFIALSGIAGFQHYDRSTKILARDYQVERIEDEVNLYEYHPFGTSEKTNNKLKHLNEPATISFLDHYPKLDGATAAYPVYGAMVQEIYKGLDETTVGQYVACSKTDEGYERLINGEIDIFLAHSHLYNRLKRQRQRA